MLNEPEKMRLIPRAAVISITGIPACTHLNL